MILELARGRKLRPVHTYPDIQIVFARPHEYAKAR